MHFRIKISVKIFVLLLVVSLTAVLLCGLVSYFTAKNTLEEESFKKLTAVREMKAAQVEDYFGLISDQITTFSNDLMVVNAMKDFTAAFQKVDDESGYGREELAAVNKKLRTYYSAEFLPRLRDNFDTTTDINDVWPRDIEHCLLQYLYIAANPHECGKKHLLVSAKDETSYSKVHAKYHSIFRDYLDKFGYYDIFLVDPNDGHIVYTVFKEVDFATTLLSGPYRNTNIARAFLAARDSKENSFVKIFDYEPYPPSYNDHASFIASPIFDGDEKVGVLIFQMPVDRINDIMTSKHQWSNVGLGASGETYIVASDYSLRNQSRFLIEDKDNFFKMIEKIGTPVGTINLIRNHNSTIGLQLVKTEGTEAALQGATGTRRFDDYRGVPVMSSYRPLEIKDLQWVIMSEIDVAEAFDHIIGFRNNLIMMICLMTLVVLIVAAVFSRSLTRPLKTLTGVAGELVKGDIEERIVSPDIDRMLEQVADRNDEVGDLAGSFRQMKLDLRSSIKDLKTTTSIKERMEGELNIGRDIQMSMLPLIFPAFPNHHEFDVYAILEPAREVGGDFYDFFFVDEDKFCFCVGDVSGKGVPSALFMAVTKTLIKSRSSNDPSTASIMTHVNDEISADNPASMFITIFIAIMNIKTGELVYTNAGHNPPYILRKDKSVEWMTNRHGPVIGAMPELAYKESKAVLNNGDILFTYTDGVTESMNENNDLYSDKRLADLLATKEYGSVKTLVEMVMESVVKFQGKADQFDDITILAVQNKVSKGGSVLGKDQITINNNLSELVEVTKKFTSFSAEYEIPSAISGKIKVALDELVNNIISYAFPDKKQHEIRITMEVSKNHVAITLVDDGIPFNPFGLKEPDTDLPLENREEGGLGLHLVRKMMDNVSYHRGINLNTVKIIKKIK